MVTHTHFKGRTKYRGNDLSHRFDNILPYKKDSRGQHVPYDNEVTCFFLFYVSFFTLFFKKIKEL
ncbi:hypothetical protein IC582_019768 [Cucumis melo]